MNQAKFEKIDGGFAGAVAHMTKGKAAYTEDEMQYVIDQDGILFYVVDGHGLRESISCFNDLSAMDWYVPKPFDVRQTMLDRPNEWVGAFKDGSGRWNKLGFDERRFVALYCDYGLDRELKYTETNVYMVTQEQLDICIPIEDVPEEATR